MVSAFESEDSRDRMVAEFSPWGPRVPLMLPGRHPSEQSGGCGCVLAGGPQGCQTGQEEGPC